MSELTSPRLTLDRANSGSGEAIEARFLVEQGGFTLDLDLTLPGRGVTAIFGHSGSGKTTLLRCLAGLTRPRDGRLVVNGEVWLDTGRSVFLPTHKRPLGYVFQEASLFPHLSVEKNLRYGLDRVRAAERRVDLSQAAELLGIEHLLERMPSGLSGGERQRVGIAQALLTSPRLLLLDSRSHRSIRSASSKSSRTWNGCTTNSISRCSTSATRRKKLRGSRIISCCSKAAAHSRAARSPIRSRASICRSHSPTTLRSCSKASSRVTTAGMDC